MLKKYYSTSIFHRHLYRVRVRGRGEVRIKNLRDKLAWELMDKAEILIHGQLISGS
jgi:hypothetical protein